MGEIDESSNETLRFPLTFPTMNEAGRVNEMRSYAELDPGNYLAGQ